MQTAWPLLVLISDRPCAEEYLGHTGLWPSFTGRAIIQAWLARLAMYPRLCRTYKAETPEQGQVQPVAWYEVLRRSSNAAGFFVLVADS